MIIIHDKILIKQTPNNKLPNQFFIYLVGTYSLNIRDNNNKRQRKICVRRSYSIDTATLK